MSDLAKPVSVFRGKRILITGDTGFKGSWLALWLSEAGADVYGYALPAEGPDSHFSLLDLSRRITHFDGDLKDLDCLSRFFAHVQPEFVFHLAAQALVRRSYREPKLTFDTNIGGSVNLMECVRETPSVKVLVYITSDKCYKNKEWVWGYREIDELGGRDPYSASKAAAEIVFSAYGDSYFSQREAFGYASARAGNVIGGGDWSEDRIVPDCIRALQAKRPIVVRNPNATRPWQHVLEPLSGYLTLAAALHDAPKSNSCAWNFGPRSDASRTVRHLTRSIVSAWGAGEIQIEADLAFHEAGLLQLNCDKALQKLNWKPRWNFERTVAETVVWYKDVHEGKSALEVSLAQIRRYQETVHD